LFINHYREIITNVQNYHHIQVSPLSPQIGAEISGVNLRDPLPPEICSEINRALIQHLVIFFRDQVLKPSDLHRAAKQFGQPVPYPFVEGIAGFPEIVEVLKQPEETSNFGGVWHSDTAYLDEPAMGAMLYAVELPATGGDTLFANMYSAYNALSSGFKAMLSTLSAINDADKTDIAQTRPYRISPALIKEPLPKNLSAIHPVIRQHPVTGEKLLFVNHAHTTRFNDMSHAESADLLEYLFKLQSLPEHCCRFNWQPGSLAFWDNRACQHYPLNDYHGHRRLMHRISLAGDKPF
jgi:taurine dioxygenase